MRLFTPAAEAGDVTGQTNLGTMDAEGHGRLGRHMGEAAASESTEARDNLSRAGIER